MVPLIAVAFTILTSRQQSGEVMMVDGDQHPLARIVAQPSPLSIPKHSPKKFGTPPTPFEFRFTTRVDVWTGSAYEPRFDIYVEEREQSGKIEASLARMLARLWSINHRLLKFDHSSDYNNRRIQVYVCNGGQAGGEQKFDQDIEMKRPYKVNTIYLYDIESFNDPVEMAREVAHEYGHATLPAVGGYDAPEYWANGFLGEKLFLTYLLREPLVTEDTMGASSAQLEAWLKKNRDPLIQHFASYGPDRAQLVKKDARGMDNYIGLILYLQSLYSPKVLSRAMQMGSEDAVDSLNAAVMAATEPESISFPIPESLKGRLLWIPLQRGRATGANTLRRSGDWALVKPTAASVTITQPSSG